MAQPAGAAPNGSGQSRETVGLMLVRVAAGVFLAAQGVHKISWLADSAPLSSQLASWLEAATPASRWYLERLLPGTPVFARLVPLGELAAGAALIAGFWTRLAAGLAFLMVLNFQVAGGAIFRLSFLTEPTALLVLCALLGLAIGGGRLPLSLRR